MDRRALLERVFKQLPVLANEEYHIEIVVDMLARIDGAHFGTAPDAFSIVGLTKTKNELTKIAKHAAALAKCFESLHQPAILLLADLGLCNMRNQLPKILHDIEDKITHADLSRIEESPKGGRPDDRVAQAVVSMLAHYYQLLTGHQPSYTIDPYDNNNIKGPFPELVQKIFDILVINRNVEHFIRKVVALDNCKK